MTGVVWPERGLHLRLQDMAVGLCVPCFGFQIFLDLSSIVCPPVSSSPSVFQCLPLSSSLSCLLVLFVGPHLRFALGNVVWGCEEWAGAW